MADQEQKPHSANPAPGAQAKQPVGQPGPKARDIDEEARQIDIGRRVMRERRAVLAALAK